MEQHCTVTAGVHWSERNKCLKKILWIHPVCKMKLKRWKFCTWYFIVMKGWKTEIVRQVKMETTFYMCMSLVIRECLCIQQSGNSDLLILIKSSTALEMWASGIMHLQCSAIHSQEKQLDVNWKHWTTNRFLQNCYLLPDTLQAEQRLDLSGQLFVTRHLLNSNFDIH